MDSTIRRRRCLQRLSFGGEDVPAQHLQRIEVFPLNCGAGIVRLRPERLQISVGRPRKCRFPDGDDRSVFVKDLHEREAHFAEAADQDGNAFQSAGAVAAVAEHGESGAHSRMNAERRAVPGVREAAVPNSEIRRALDPPQIAPSHARIHGADILAPKLLDEQPVAHEAARSEVPPIVAHVATFIPRRPDDALPPLPSE